MEEVRRKVLRTEEVRTVEFPLSRKAITTTTWLNLDGRPTVPPHQSGCLEVSFRHAQQHKHRIAKAHRLKVSFLRRDYNSNGSTRGATLCVTHHVPTSETLATANRLTEGMIQTARLDDGELGCRGPGMTNPYLSHALLGYLRDATNFHMAILSILSDVFRTEINYSPTLVCKAEGEYSLNGPQKFLALAVHPDLWAEKMRELVHPKEQYCETDVLLNTILLRSLGYANEIKKKFTDYYGVNLRFQPPSPRVDRLPATSMLYEDVNTKRLRALPHFLALRLPWFYGPTFFVDDTVRDSVWWRFHEDTPGGAPYPEEEENENTG